MPTKSVSARLASVAAAAVLGALALGDVTAHASTGSSATASSSTISALVPNRGVLFGTSNGPQPFPEIESTVGRKFDIHRDYDFWDDQQPTRVVRTDLATGHVPALSIMTKRRGGGVVPWARIASGAEDAQIIAQARGFKALGAPLLVALNHEPENDLATHGTQAEFRAAYRHWVSVYRAQGATNVAFTWILMRGSFTTNAEADGWYPGDDVVDWLGVDAYNWYQCRRNKWTSFAAATNSFRRWAAGHQKPLIVAEYGTGEDPADPTRKGQWFRDAAEAVRTWPQLKALVYFHHDAHPAGLNNCGWPFDTSASSLAGFRTLANDPGLKPTWAPGTQLPSVVTGTVADLAGTSASVSGVVNPHGAATTYHAEFGTTSAYGTSTGETPLAFDAVTGADTDVPVSVALTGLAPRTTYHVRFVATSTAGTVTSAETTFTTGGAPTVAAYSASGLTTTSVTLNGAVRPNGLPTTYHYEWGTTTAYGTLTADVALPAGSRSVRIAQPMSGLTPTGLYHYRLVATNAAGTTVGADHTISLPGAPRVGTYGAKSVTGTSATLAGLVDPNRLETKYWFEWGTTTAYGKRTPVTSAGADNYGRTRKFTVTGLARATTYHYRIVATNSAGTSVAVDRSFRTDR